MKTKKTIKVLSLLLSLLMILALFAGCNNAPGSKNDDKTVVIYAAALLESLHPHLVKGYPGRYISNNVYETLAIVNNDGSVSPKLAESWDITDGGLTYTFKLVEDAYFHNGEKLTANDVVFSYNYMKDYPLAQKYHEMVDTVTALDEHTVQFKLNRNDPLFLAYTHNSFILNEKFVTDPKNDLSTAACGTGPYKVVSFDSATSCFLEANEDYRDGAPAIKKAEIRYVSDAASASVSLMAGELTIMEVPPAQAKSLIDSGNYNYQFVTPLHTAIIAFNCSKPPFDNKLLRQALSYAADKETMIEVAYEGLGKVARIQAGTNCFGVDFSDAPDISYNPEKAKELLAQAGYPNGVNLTEEFGIVFKTIAGGYHEKLGQVFHQNLADIGVTVEMIATETPDEDAVNGDFDFMNEGMSYRADFSFNEYQYGSIGLGANNFSHYSDPWVDEMFGKGKTETDPEKRKEIYRELIAYLIDACPSIPVMHRQSTFMWDKSLNVPMLYDNAADVYHIYEWNWVE